MPELLGVQKVIENGRTIGGEDALLPKLQHLTKGVK